MGRQELLLGVAHQDIPRHPRVDKIPAPRDAIQETHDERHLFRPVLLERLKHLGAPALEGVHDHRKGLTIVLGVHGPAPVDMVVLHQEQRVLENEIHHRITAFLPVEGLYLDGRREILPLFWV